LSLPNGGRHEDVIRTKAFADYIRDHVVSWYTWAQKNKLGVERMEELILVSGCTLVTSWAAAVFVDNTMKAEISLASRTLNNGGASFVWSNNQGAVVYHNSRSDPVRSLGYVYLAGTYFFCCMESKIHLQLGINVSSSGASEQSASSSGPDESEREQNPFLTTLTIAKTMR
jgi:hypothetical protein